MTQSQSSSSSSLLSGGLKGIMLEMVDMTPPELSAAGGGGTFGVSSLDELFAGMKRRT